MSYFKKKKKTEGLPWWSGVKNPPSNAGDVGLATEIPHTKGQISPHATNTRYSQINKNFFKKEGKKILKKKEKQTTNKKKRRLR